MSAFGIEGSRDIWEEMPPNLMILSSTSRGHVPVPLFMRELRWRPSGVKKRSGYFAGYLPNHPIRIKADKDLKQHFSKEYLNGKPKEDFVNVYRKYKVILSPRGVSRGAFRHMESLQLGCVLFYVTDSCPWISYDKPSFHWENMSFRAFPDNLVNVFQTIVDTPVTKIQEMEETIKNNRHFFVLKGFLEEVGRFFVDPDNSYLTCGKYQDIVA